MVFPHVVIKAWGKEIWFANNAEKNYCGKELQIDHGWQLSLHRHLVKDETFYIMAGPVVVEYSDNADGSGLKMRRLLPGDRFHVPAGRWHRLRAATRNASVIEASTFHDDADVERLVPSCQV